MSTTLFLRNSTDMVARERWSSGTNTNKDDGNAGTWRPWFPLSTVRGASEQVGIGFNTVASATYYIEGYQSSIPVQFISPPLAHDITISGTVTYNFWGAENNMSANCGFACKVYRIRGSDGSIQDLVDKSADGVELAVTTSAVRNWTSTPTSTNFLKGDRILLLPCINAVGTMGGGYTAFFSWNGATSGSTGDTYVTFTENIGFITTNPGTEQVSNNATTSSNFGADTGQDYIATCFFWDSSTLTSVETYLDKVGSPADNVVLAIQADSGGDPSGTDIVTQSVAGSSIGTSGAWVSFDITDTALSPGKYWLVHRRSGSLDAANYYRWYLGAAAAGGAADQSPITWRDAHSTTGWFISRSGAYSFKLHGGQAGTQIFPTNTAGQVDPNGASYDSKDAWTSRGAGVQTSATTTVAGWTAPILCTVSGGGNYIEWFSHQLQAFTLGGAVLLHIRAKTNLSDIGTFRIQIAVCNSDGTTPVAWAENGYFGDPGQAETTTEIWLSGDDVSVTNGQRLRFRIYADDESNTAMVVSNTLTIYYAGAVGATGDSYLIFPQVLAEYSSGTQYPQSVAVTATLTLTAAKMPKKPIDITSALSTVLSRLSNKPLSLSSTLTSVVTRMTSKPVPLGITLTVSNATSKIKQLAIAVTSTVTAAVTKQAGKLVAATSTLGVDQTRQLSFLRIVAVSVTHAVALTKQLPKTIAVSVTHAVALTKQAVKAVMAVSVSHTVGLMTIKVKILVIDVATTVGAALVKQAGKPIAVTVSHSVALTKQAFKLVNMAVSHVVSLTKQVSKAFSIALTATTSLVATKVFIKLIDVTSTITTALVTQALHYRTLAVSVVHTVGLSTQAAFARAIAVTSTVTVSLVKKVNKALDVTVPFFVELFKKTSITVAVTSVLNVAVTVGKILHKTIDVTTTFVVDLVAQFIPGGGPPPPVVEMLIKRMRRWLRRNP